MHKISIISRGQALGYTISLPTEDKFLTTRAELSDTLAMTLGGRAAEEIVFSEITTGAANDLEKVTATAKQMVMRFGMSEKLGPRDLRPRPVAAVPRPRVQRGARLLGRDRARDRRRDPPHRRGGAPDRAPRCWTTAATTLDRISRLLLEHETIEREEFEALLDGKSEEEVFGAREPELEPPRRRRSSRARRSVSEPRSMPRPRPGLAGGTAEMRKDP